MKRVSCVFYVGNVCFFCENKDRKNKRECRIILIGAAKIKNKKLEKNKPKMIRRKSNHKIKIKSNRERRSQ
jgi:hypothetical protein